MTITTDPAYPVVGETITLTITAATGQTAATQFSLTSVPSRSALTTGLLVDDNGDPVQTFVGDCQGAFGVIAHDHRRTTGGESYPGDPAGAARDDLVAVQTGSVYVGALAELPIVTKFNDGATLRLRVVNATIRAAELVDPLTEVSRMASLEPAVVAALAALVGVAVTAMDVDFATDVNTIYTAYTGHIALTSGSVHMSADGVNVARVEPVNSIEGGIMRLRDLFDRYMGHAQATALGGTWHETDDGKNLPVTVKPSSLAQATVHKADLRERCYRRHIAQVASPPSHGGVDATNTIAVALPLPAFISAFLDALVDANPTAAAGEQEGAVDIGRAFGFTVAP